MSFLVLLSPEPDLSAMRQPSGKPACKWASGDLAADHPVEKLLARTVAQHFFKEHLIEVANHGCRCGGVPWIAGDCRIQARLVAIKTGDLVPDRPCIASPAARSVDQAEQQVRSGVVAPFKCSSAQSANTHCASADILSSDRRIFEKIWRPIGNELVKAQISRSTRQIEAKKVASGLSNLHSEQRGEAFLERRPTRYEKKPCH